MWGYAFFFAVALLSGLGIGSAGLPVLYLTLVQKLPQLTSQALNLIFFLFSSGAALLVHLLRTPLLVGAILLMLPAGIVGSLLGTAIAEWMPQELLRTLFGVFLIITGSVGLFKKGKK